MDSKYSYKMSKIAKDAFASRNYQLAIEMFERCLREKCQQHEQQNQQQQHHHHHHHHQQKQKQQQYQQQNSSTIELYFWYGDSLARSGRIYEAFDIYAQIASNLDEIIPIERFKNLCLSLIDSVINVNYLNSPISSTISSSSTTTTSATLSSTSSSSSSLLSLPSSPSPLTTTLSSSTLSTSTLSTIATTSPTTLTNCIGNEQISTIGRRFNQHQYQNDLDLTRNQKHYHQQQQQQQQQQCHQKFHQQQLFSTKYLDPLLCPICEDILRCPVTATCGHTYCRQCCEGSTLCHLCGVKFPVVPVIGGNIVNLKTDVLIRRLIDKWWPHELRARELNDEALHFLDSNALDDALKCCNESLEKSPNNHKSLLLRSEVLYRLNHMQSSLADADNALKARPTSAKAYHRRALALAGLGRTEEALISQCLAASLDINLSFTMSSSFRNEICRLLQRFFVPSVRSNSSTSISLAPYSVVMTRRRRRRRKLMEHVITQSIGNSDCDEMNSSCGEDDHHFLHKTRRYSRRMASLAVDCTVPRPNLRLRALLDRIQQEVQKLKRLEMKSSFQQVNHLQIEVSDFDCVLCCRTLWRPVITPCGHTYCWVCLDRCMDYSSSCPLCMSPLIEQYRTNYRGSSTPVPFSLAKKSVTKFLEAAMKKFIPEWYEKRHRLEVEEEPSVPVFICTTAFPHVPCPLFVYEPRYRLMVRRAIESGERQFGIVQPHTGKSRYSDVGTMLDIRDCVLLGDGCSILSTIGCRRFRILTRDEKDGYETAKVEYIYDEPIPENYITIVSEMHSSVLRKAIKWYESLGDDIKEEILRSFGPMPVLENDWERIADGPAWAWWIIAILPLNQQLKVNILATTSLEKRLRAIGKTLDYITGRVRRSQQSCVVVQCEGLPACQAIDCCQRAATSTSTADDQTNEPTEFML